MKQQKKLIAVVVVFAFLAMLQASTMPLRAEQSPAQTETSMTGAEQGPNYIEEEGAPSSGGKKSIMPVVLIGLGVVAVAAVLVLVVLKTKYDIVGKWTLTWKYEGDPQNSNTITFTGDKKTGTFAIGGASGTYTVDSKKVTWVYAGGNTTYTGEFTDKTHMSGTMVSYGYPGTWSAVKQATTTSVSVPAAAGKNGEKQR